MAASHVELAFAVGAADVVDVVAITGIVAIVLVVPVVLAVVESGQQRCNDVDEDETG